MKFQIQAIFLNMANSFFGPIKGTLNQDISYLLVILIQIIKPIIDILVQLRARSPYSTRVAGGYPYIFLTHSFFSSIQSIFGAELCSNHITPLFNYL